MGLCEEGIQQAKEASEIYERLGDTVNQAQCLITLADSLYKDKQLDAAEEAASRAVNLLSGKDEQLRVCQCHRVLGEIYSSKRETEKAVHHFDVALGIASSFDWPNELFCIRYSLAGQFYDQRRFDDAHAHIERAKSHAVNDTYKLGRAMQLQANIWYSQERLEQAKSEGLRAADVYEKLGAARDLEMCRKLLQWIDDKMKMNGPVASDGLDGDGEFPGTQCNQRCLLTLRVQTGSPNPNDGVCLDFFRCILPQAASPPTRLPFSPLPLLPSPHLPPSTLLQGVLASIHVYRSTPAVPLFVVDLHHVLYLSVSPLDVLYTRVSCDCL